MSLRTSHLVTAAVLVLAGMSCPLSYAGSGSDFRFLTQDLPRGSTNIEYAATILTANASGPVTFSVSPNPPAPGLSFNNATGFLSGIPTEVNASGFDVTFTANDGTTTLDLKIKLSINASGGGGNSGVSFATTFLPDGRVGAVYTATLQAQNAVGPVLFGATDLPPGLSLSGLTGEITGTPSGPGTYYVTFSATDRGENDNKVFTVLSLLVFPEASDFQFTNVILNNGEVGTPYTETLTTSGAGGAVSYSASGLPPGTAVDSDSGVISGTPTTSGTYLVNLAATDGTDTLVLNRTILIVPSSTSSFLWDFFGLPAAIVNIEYGRQPPILIAASNGSNSVSYSATGLPSGITYDANTGELAGIAIEVGINPVVFTATDSASGEVLELAIDFVILPPNGGDTNSLPINLWVKKMTLKPSQGQDAAWKAYFIYNADRRPANAFDPATHTFSVSIGSRTLTVDPGGMTNSNGRFSFKSAKGATPIESVTVDPRKQVIVLSTKKDAIPDSVPGVLRHTMILGNKGYKLDLFFDSKGKFTPTSGYRKTAFVVDKAKVSTKGTLVLSMLLGDPSFTYTSGTSIMRFRMLNAATVLVDKAFTDLVSSKESTDRRTGGTVFKLKGSKDAAAANTLSKFSYLSSKGKLILAMKNVDLSGLPASPAHVGVELTVGDKIYSTAVTLFAPSGGTFTTVQK